MKAKPIDRLALTREKFGAKMYGNNNYPKTPENYPKTSEHQEGYSTCPNCGQETLIHEDGCMHCRSCGWSACG